MSFTSTGYLDGNGMGCLKLILKVVFLYGPPFVAATYFGMTLTTFHAWVIRVAVVASLAVVVSIHPLKI